MSMADSERKQGRPDDAGELQVFAYQTLARLCLCLTVILSAGQARADTWGHFEFDPGVSVQDKENFLAASGVVSGLFAEYGIVLKFPVTAIVTSNTENYIRALMQYGNLSRADAEKKAINEVVNLGLSTPKPVILLRWIPTRVLTAPGQSHEVVNPKMAFYFAHELFHQVQNQYRSDFKIAWLLEGSAEVFRDLALERASLQSMSDAIREDEGFVGAREAIPDVRQIDTPDYKAWSNLAQQGLPVYSMATIMTSKLLANGGFGKILTYYRLLNDGVAEELAFSQAFGVSKSDFLDYMNNYFAALRG